MQTNTQPFSAMVSPIQTNQLLSIQGESKKILNYKDASLKIPSIIYRERYSAQRPVLLIKSPIEVGNELNRTVSAIEDSLKKKGFVFAPPSYFIGLVAEHQNLLLEKSFHHITACNWFGDEDYGFILSAEKNKLNNVIEFGSHETTTFDGMFEFIRSYWWLAVMKKI